MESDPIQAQSLRDELVYYDRQDIFLKGEGEDHPSNYRDNNLLRSQSAEMLSTSSRSK